MLNYPKSEIGKINFLLGRNPHVVRYKKAVSHLFIPKPYKAVFILSADFELAWAWRYSIQLVNPGKSALVLARKARDNIPVLIDLCDEYDIPITWATVGHLFLDKCSRDKGLPHSDIERLPYHVNKYWRYKTGDWFDDDPCTDWQTSPEWYAPDLIRVILDAKADHEIACHTFSHIDASDKVCSSDVFEREIRGCIELAEKYGIRLESFVHPGHIVGNLDKLRVLGFSSYRTDYNHALGYPVRHENGLWEFRTTAEFGYKKSWSFDYHVWRYKKIIDRAIKYGRLCYFFFHPSNWNLDFVKFVTAEIFAHLKSRSDEILITTCAKYLRRVDQ